MTESLTTTSSANEHVHLDHSQEAKDATEQEKNMSLMQAIKLYPKAVAWSVFISAAIIMEGYDIVLLSSFYALPQFNKKFGVSIATQT
jgi:SP family general alpha glucoside:H+ symporter-like MFS transporter